MVQVLQRELNGRCIHHVAEESRSAKQASYGIGGMTSMKKTPYDIFQDAIKAGIRPSIHDCWADFAGWEMARRFTDDPSHPAKAAIEWICAMEELRCGLTEFIGEAKSDCLAALDQAYEAFAKLEHSAELIHAIETWMEFRLSS